MIRMKFESALRQKEEAFIKFKKDFGHVYDSQTYHLLDFDRFCLAEYPEEDSLTEDMVMRWSVIKDTETSNGYISRITTVRQFGKYLAMMGEDAFILPEGLKGGDILRPIEARRMDREDVNLKTGRIFVRESKYNKERVIYAPDELLSLTRDYLGKIAAVFPGSAALFVDRKGGRLSKDAHQYLFEHCRAGSGIKESGTKRPNMYSFRHSFATHRIYQWHKDGKYISSLLPGLSAYMGHTRYQHTLYYLHFLPELFSDMAGFDLEQFSEIIPGVTNDD